MKPFLFFSIFLFFTGCQNTSNENESQVIDPTSTDTIRTNLDTSQSIIEFQEDSLSQEIKNIFEYSISSSHEELAELMAYRGKDEARLFRDRFNPKDPLELKTVKQTADIIKMWLNESSSYKLKNYSEFPQEDGIWYVREVNFISTAGINKKFFAFIKMKDEYVLADIKSKLPS